MDGKSNAIEKLIIVRKKKKKKYKHLKGGGNECINYGYHI